MKGGIDYFPLECQLNEKMELIEAEFGLVGFAVILKLYQRIYSGDGYYCKWTPEVALLFARRIGAGGSAVDEIIQSAIKRGLFDKERFERYGILTSAGIQKRYLEATERRQTVPIIKEYCIGDIATIFKNVDISSKNVNISSENVYISKQSKVKESKVEKSKKKETRERFSPPSLDEVKKYCEERGNRISPQSFIDFYSSKGWMIGKSKMRDWMAAVRTWESRDKGQKQAINYDEEE